MNQTKLMTLLLGGSLVFSYSPFEQAWLPLAVLTLLLLLLRNSSPKQAFAHGFWFGLGWFGAGLSWIYVSIDQFGGLHPLASIAILLVLYAYLSLFPAVALWLWKWSEHKFGPSAIWLLPGFWLLTESLRGWLLTGFPWLELGYSQTDASLGQYAAWVGVSGVSLIVWLIAISLYRGWQQRCLLPTAVATALLLVSFALPQWSQLERTGETKRVLLVQGNISQSIKWNPDQHWRSLTTYLELSKPFYSSHDIIVWPESAVTMPEPYTDDILANIHQDLVAADTSLITGIIDYSNREYFNSLITLGMDAPYQPMEAYYHGHSNRYAKHQLLPIGEFVPFENLLRPLAPLFDLPMSSFSRGDYVQPDLRAKGQHLTAAICYEIAFPNQVRANLKPNSDFLITVSNDTWFGASHGPAQHMQIARMRSIELGRPLLRATNNGITAVVNEYGQELARAPQFVAATLSAQVPLVQGTTPFYRNGLLNAWIIALMIAICGIFGMVKRRQNQ